jgi:hypothetical protein
MALLSHCHRKFPCRRCARGAAAKVWALARPTGLERSPTHVGLRLIPIEGSATLEAALAGTA